MRATSMPNDANQADGAAQESSGCLAALVGQDLGVGEPGRVVDGDVHELPAGDATLLAIDGRLMAAPPVADDAMTCAERADPPELLDVEVDELTRALALVAIRRLGRREPGA